MRLLADCAQLSTCHVNSSWIKEFLLPISAAHIVRSRFILARCFLFLCQLNSFQRLRRWSRNKGQYLDRWILISSLHFLWWPFIHLVGSIDFDREIICFRRRVSVRCTLDRARFVAIIGLALKSFMVNVTMNNWIQQRQQVRGVFYLQCRFSFFSNDT